MNVEELVNDAMPADEMQGRANHDALVRRRADKYAREALDQETAEGFELPVLATLTELLAEPDEDEPYRIMNLLPTNGRVILSAAQKSGKTTMVGNCARCLVDGGEFLGAFKVEPVTGKVVIFDTEMSRRQLREWLRRQQIKNTDQIVLISLRGAVDSFRITNPVIRALWAERLREIGAEVIILDPLNPVLNACGADENSNSEVGRVLDSFDALLKDSGAREAIVAHHMGHNGERARGASKLRGWPDAEWKIVSDEETYERFFSAYGRDVNQPEAPLVFESGRLSVDLGVFSNERPMTRKEAQKERKLAEILAAIEAEPGVATNGLPGRRDDRPLLVKELVKRELVYTRPGPNRSTKHFPGADPEGEPQGVEVVSELLETT